MGNFITRPIFKHPRQHTSFQRPYDVIRMSCAKRRRLGLNWPTAKKSIKTRNRSFRLFFHNEERCLVQFKALVIYFVLDQGDLCRYQPCNEARESIPFSLTLNQGDGLLISHTYFQLLVTNCTDQITQIP